MDTLHIDNFQLDLGGPSEIGMAVMLAVMMLAVALDLRPEHFKILKTQPRIFITGCLAQIIGLPILTLGVCFWVNPHPSVALGMVIVSCCPGGNVSNLMSLFARANTALSVSLTATSSLFAAFVTPLSIVFWSTLYPPTRELLTQIDFDALAFLIQALLILAFPLIVGMVISVKSPHIARRLHKPLAWIGGLGLLFIIIIALTTYWGAFLQLGMALIGLVILHNGLAFALGYGSARLVGAGEAERRTLTLEVGLQNSGLAIVILVAQLGGLGGAAAIAGLWGTWHIIAGLSLVGLFRLKDRRVYV